jgi:hypothetical protein
MRTSAHGRTSRSSSKRRVKSKGATQSARAASAPTVAVAGTKPPATPLDSKHRRARIAQAVPLRAKRRGLAAGPELDDGLTAKSQVDDEPLLAHQLAHSDT